MRLDRYYIENWSFLLDIKIIFLTVVSLVTWERKSLLMESMEYYLPFLTPSIVFYYIIFDTPSSYQAYNKVGVLRLK